MMSHDFSPCRVTSPAAPDAFWHVLAQQLRRRRLPLPPLATGAMGVAMFAQVSLSPPTAAMLIAAADEPQPRALPAMTQTTSRPAVVITAKRG